MEKGNILITANSDLAAPFVAKMNPSNKKLLHLPLEVFKYEVDENDNRMVHSSMDDFAYVIHGNLRNARFFVRWMQEFDLSDAIRQKVNLVSDQATADFLESYNIAPVMPLTDAKPIDILEFILRISYQGDVLYPTTDQKGEELPGLFQELEMPVFELPVCSAVKLEELTLKRYRKYIDDSKIDAVIFHNRSSVIKIKTAFPGVDFNQVTCIAADTGVGIKMENEGLLSDYTAKGSWKSLADVILNLDLQQ